MTGLRRVTRLVLAAVSLLLAGCGLPVHVGVKATRAAGMTVPPLAPGWVIPAAARMSGAVLTAPAVPQPADADELVGLALRSDEPVAPGPVTFGQVFAPGALHPGDRLVARIGRRETPAQLDVKVTHPDGSVRMGVVTLMAPAPADVMLVRRPRRPIPASVDLARLAGRYDVTVAMLIHGEAGDSPRHFDLGALLAEALRSGRVSYWLRGPLVTEGRIETPVAGSLRLTADIRAHADGSVVTDLQFNNDIAMRPGGGMAEYDVTVSQGGRAILRETGLRHFQYQTWHQEIRSGADPGVTIIHDVAALARTGAIHTYDLAMGVSADLIERQRRQMDEPGFGILGNAGLAKYMGMTGGRPDIGPLTLANTAWLMTQHKDAARFALAQADAAGSIPWHFFDAETGTYLTLDRYPKLWSDGRGGSWGTQGLLQKLDERTGWTPDAAHQPDLSYVPYLMTGSRYRLDQLLAQAGGTVLMLWPAPRQEGRGLIVNGTDQVRGQAWALRNVVEAAYVAPDDSPLQGYFRRLLARNVSHMLDVARGADRDAVHGWFMGDYGGAGVIAPWQQDFLASTMILAARQGVPGAREVVAWQADFLVDRFLAGDRGLPPYDAIAYNMAMFHPGSRRPLRTWREVAEATAALGMSGGGSAFPKGVEGYGQAAIGVLAGIVTVTGSPDAQRALDWMRAHFSHADRAVLRGNPTWAILPAARPGG